MSGILGSLYDLGLRMDEDFTLAIKAIIQADEITVGLAPGFSLITEGVADARELIMEAVTAERIVDEVRSAAMQTGKEILRRLPSLQEATLSWLDQYQKGKIVVELDTSDLGREIGRFSVARTAAGGRGDPGRGGRRDRHRGRRDAVRWARTPAIGSLLPSRDGGRVFVVLLLAGDASWRGGCCGRHRTGTTPRRTAARSRGSPGEQPLQRRPRADAMERVRASAGTAR